MRDLDLKDIQIRARMYKQGLITEQELINAVKALLQQTHCSKPLPPVSEIEQTLNLAQCELRSMYRKVGILESNILKMVDETWEKVRAAMA